MEFLDDDRKKGFDAVVDDEVKILDGLFVFEIELEFVVHFLDGFVRLQGDVGDVSVEHQRKQIEDQISVSTQMQEGGDAMLLEGLKVFRSVAAHRFHHFFAQLHRRRQGFRVAAENEPEVDVKQFTASGQKEIVVVPISDAQYIGDDAVTASGQPGGR